MITVQVIPYMPKPLVMEPSWRPIILANDQVQGTHSHRHHKYHGPLDNGPCYLLFYLAF